MQTIRQTAMALAAAMALVALATSTAAAEEFSTSGTGKLVGKALNTQKLKTGGLATVECTSASPTGEVTSEKYTEQKLSISYGSCTVSGLGSATVSLADYTFFLPKLVSILKPITITAKALGVECEISVPAGQSLGNAAGEIEYANKEKGGKGTLEAKIKITKIASEVIKSNNSSLCGTVGEKSTTGTYTGNDEVELEGGTVGVTKCKCYRATGGMYSDPECEHMSSTSKLYECE
jgi:hypothetical protein